MQLKLFSVKRVVLLGIVTIGALASFGNTCHWTELACPAANNGQCFGLTTWTVDPSFVVYEQGLSAAQDVNGNPLIIDNIQAATRAFNSDHGNEVLESVICERQAAAACPESSPVSSISGIYPDYGPSKANNFAITFHEFHNGSNVKTFYTATQCWPVPWTSVCPQDNTVTPFRARPECYVAPADNGCF